MKGRCKRNVVIFRKELLPLSETFIRDQFLSYSDWKPHLAGYRFCAGLDLTEIPAFVLEQAYPRALKWLCLKAYQHLQYIGIFPQPLKHYVEKIRPEIVHAHFGYDAILIYDIAKALRIPLVVTLHGTDILSSPDAWRSGKAGFFFRCYPTKLETLFRDENVFFIAVSQALREKAVERGVPAERCVVRYTGASDAYFSPSAAAIPRSKTVLFVGRLVEFKGCEFLLRAMAIVQRKVPDAELVIIGDGPLNSDLRFLANNLGIKASFLGPRSRNEVQQWMSKSRVFCLPSVTDADEAFEAFGMVILEAQFSGLPVITSARGGCEAVIHGKTGFVFAERDYHTLAQYIVQLMNEDSLWRDISEQARERALGSFTLETCTKRIEDYYDEILRVSSGERSADD